ncbi:MAG TPA: phosphoenolpyruvate-utilizing N-terminal domain-containing protein, partial [Bacteroidota bacterium]
MVLARNENREFRAVGASPGIAIGQVRITDRSRVAVVETGIEPAEIPSEVERFKDALASAAAELRAIRQQLEKERGPEHLYVIDAHMMILRDSML